MTSAWPVAIVFVAAVFVAAAIAYWVFSQSRERANLVEPDDPDERHVFRTLPPGQFVEVDGFKIRFIQKGRGRDVVLIHGFCESIVTWRLVFNELAQRYRVTALDLPGFGFSSKLIGKKYDLDSQANRLWLFLDRLNIKNPCLVGHSLGAAISAWMAKCEPKKIAKIALLAPAIDRGVVWIHPRSVAWIGSMVRPFIVTPTVVRQVYLKRCVVKPPADLEDVLPEFYRPFHHSPNAMKIAMKHTWLLYDKRLPAGLANLITPVLVVAGEKDQVVKLNLLDRFLEHNPCAQSIVLPNIGHQIQEECPDIVIQKLCDFIGAESEGQKFR